MITLDEIKKARKRFKGIIHKTKLSYSTSFSKISNNKVYMKPENIQKTGSFKIRGAYNKIVQLTEEEKKHGVIASSAGNHAQGVALAASKNSINSTIVMPKGAPLAKITATRNYGANIILYGDVYDETYQKAMKIKEDTGATFIHPFNDPDVIAGQGTVALEILDELPETDIIIAPIGGGGLISGIAVAAKSIKPDIKIIGIEALSAASMKTSIERNELTTLEKINTIADGISVKTPGNLTFKICKKYLDDVITVNDEEIAGAILMLLERTKMVVEGAGATTIAALLNNKIPYHDKVVVPILSGGNIDFNIISRIIERGLAKAGRKTIIKTCIKDKPGSLSHLLTLIAKLDANVISINHNHYQPGIPFDDAEVELELETKDEDHVNKVHETLNKNGYNTHNYCKN